MQSLPYNGRRDFLTQSSALFFGAVLLPATALSQAASSQATPFAQEHVLEIARELARSPYERPESVPETLRDLTYDQYRDIRYRKDAAIWGESPSGFSVEFFAPGSLYRLGIEVSLVDEGQSRPAPIEADSFEAPTPEIAEILAAINKVAGFRVHYPLNQNDYADEFVVFQGASYFRGVSRNQHYGLSARGLAIDVAEPTGEEFPLFRRFWIERPAAGATAVVVHALLDSERITGAYRFEIFPGEPTRMEIDATLFPRETLTHVGLGNLTSMYLFGQMDRPEQPDYRNAIHDSSGLAMHNGQDEYLWRPLNNPAELQISSFADHSPRGFGLIQRSRRLEDFQDLEAQYHLRPSAWVTPRHDWGEGHVILIEIPTPNEVNDNIVAYWRPKDALQPDEPFHLSYRLDWPDDSPLPADIARIRRSAYGLKLATPYPQLVIDYEDLPENISLEEIRFEARLSDGSIIEDIVQPYGENGARLFLTFDPEGSEVIEVQAFPQHQGERIGETFLFRWLES